MRWFGRVFVLICLSALPAKAEITADSVRQMLLADKFDLLEAQLASAHRTAVVERDFQLLRSVYVDVFQTVHSAVFQATLRWQEQHSSSPYAATALFYQHHQRAFQVRGYETRQGTVWAAHASFGDEMASANAALTIALREADDFVPALDAAFRAYRVSGKLFADLDELLENALALAPTRRTVDLMIMSEDQRWGGSPQDAYNRCVSRIGSVAGLSREYCFARVIYTSGIEGQGRADMFEIVRQMDDPDVMIQMMRLDGYMGPWRDEPGANQKARELLKTHLNPTTDPTTYLWRVARLAWQDGAYDIEFEINTRIDLAEAMKERLLTSPHDIDVLRTLIDHELWLLQQRVQVEFENQLRALNSQPLLHLPEADLSRAQDYWSGILALGAARADTWWSGISLKAALLEQPFDIAPLRPYYENLIVTSNHSPSSLKRYMDFLYERYRIATGEQSVSSDIVIDHEAMLEEVLCPMIRVERLFTHACNQDQSDSFCHVQGYSSDFPVRIREIRRQTGVAQCVWETRNPPEALEFRGHDPKNLSVLSGARN